MRSATWHDGRLAVGALATVLASVASLRAETVAEGVTFTTYNAPGPNRVHVVAADALRAEYKLKVGWAQGKRYYTARERTSQISARYDHPPEEDVLAAINGSFFDAANPPRLVGIGQTDGQMLDTPTFNPSYTYHTVMVGPSRRPVVRTNFAHAYGTIRFADGHQMPLNQYNFTMSGPLVPINGTTVFTPHFDTSTRTSFINPSLAVEVAVGDVSYPMRGDKEISGVITAIHAPTAGNNPIPAGGLVLSAWGSTASEILAHAQPGARLGVRIASGAPEYNNSDNALTGMGWIIRDGATYPTGWTSLESGASPYSRNPRTVLAWNAQQWFLVVCDGRSTPSVGMTFQEMADFLTGTLGATDAVNYDGGGSSTIVVDGTVRNVPSDGSERYVANAILLVRRDTATAFPLADEFPPAGRGPGWDDKFSYNGVIPFTPAASGGDGYVLQVMNPAGGVETVRRGDFGDTDYVVECDIYCEYRPEDAPDGYERYALFARDDGTGALDLAAGGYGKGNCYALTFDSHDGRVRAGKYVQGLFTDFMAEPMFLPSTAWRRFRIACAGSQITFSLDGATVASATDTTFPRGYFGLGYAEFFATDALMHGTRADRFEAYVAGTLPLAASAPVPAQAAACVPMDSDLAWTPGAGANSHDVYFGTAPPGVFQGNRTAATFDPGALEPDTTYYWRIDEVNENGTTPGVVWSFTTRHYRGDLDRDRDVDQADFGLLQACLTGVSVPSTDPACGRARQDADTDVDPEDVAAFLQCLGASGQTPDPECLCVP